MDNMVIEDREKQIEVLQKKYDAMFVVKRQMEDMIKKHQKYEVDFVSTYCNVFINILIH